MWILWVSRVSGETCFELYDRIGQYFAITRWWAENSAHPKTTHCHWSNPPLKSVYTGFPSRIHYRWVCVSTVSDMLLLHCYCIACSVNSILGGSPETAAANGTIIYQAEVPAVHISIYCIHCYWLFSWKKQQHNFVSHWPKSLSLLWWVCQSCSSVGMFVSTQHTAVSVVGHCDTRSHRCDEQWRNF